MKSSFDIAKVSMLDCNRQLEIYTAPTKSKSIPDCRASNENFAEMHNTIIEVHDRGTKKLGPQMLTKVGQQMHTKLGQQMLMKIDRQLFHTIATDGRLAGANQQMFLTYTIDYVTPGRFFCLAF